MEKCILNFNSPNTNPTPNHNFQTPFSVSWYYLSSPPTHPAHQSSHSHLQPMSNLDDCLGSSVGGGKNVALSTRRLPLLLICSMTLSKFCDF